MQNPGLSPAVQEAIQRRQQGNPQPALNQVSPQAAMAQPMPQPATDSSLNKSSAPQSMPQEKWTPTNQDDAIVAALIEKMKNNDKLRKEQATMAAQPSPQPGQGGGGYLEHKIPKLMSEGYPQKQAVAIAYSMKERGKGGGFSMSPGYEQPMAVNQMQSNYQSGMGKDYSGMNNYGR